MRKEAWIVCKSHVVDVQVTTYSLLASTVLPKVTLALHDFHTIKVIITL